MNNILVDLHTHTSCSDGEFSPEQLYNLIKEYAKDKKVVWSVTDHNCVDAYDFLKQIQDDKLTIINGCELEFSYKNKTKDILAYNFDINKMKIFLNEYYNLDKKIKRQEEILTKFKNICKNNNLKFDNNIEIKTGKIGEAYNLMMKSLKKYECNLKICPDIGVSGFYRKHFINQKSQFYVKDDFELLNLKQVIDVIHSFGGLAFIAHSFDYAGETIEEVLTFLTDAKNAGVDGVEIMHFSIDRNKEQILRNFIKENNLLESGGTDYHGKLVKNTVKLFTGRDNNVNINIKNLKWIKNI